MPTINKDVEDMTAAELLIKAVQELAEKCATIEELRESHKKIKK